VSGCAAPGVFGANAAPLGVAAIGSEAAPAGSRLGLGFEAEPLALALALALTSAAEGSSFDAVEAVLSLVAAEAAWPRPVALAAALPPPDAVALAVMLEPAVPFAPLAEPTPEGTAFDALPPRDVGAGVGAAAGGGFVGAGGADGGAAAASRRAANGWASVSCVSVDACCHCEDVVETVAVTSDAILGTGKPLRKVMREPACNRRASAHSCENYVKSNG
jgi:hypothetical protein